MARRKKLGQKTGSQARPWEPLRAAVVSDVMREHTLTRATHVACWINDRYQVIVEEFDSEAFDAPMSYLSIKRRDKNPVRDWRHLQQIKNELVGEECEAFEIFPASSRLVDEANQFHLWAFRSPRQRIPVGFNERLVTGPEESGATGGVGRPRQRAFEEGLSL